MASSVAVMAGSRHHGSFRSVRSLICALVLAGAFTACVIVDVSALELSWGRAAGRMRFPWRMVAVPCEPYSQGISPQRRGARLHGCDSYLTGCRAGHAAARGGSRAGRSEEHTSELQS